MQRVIESAIDVWYVVLCSDYKTCAVLWCFFGCPAEHASRLLASAQGATSLVSREEGGKRKQTRAARIKTSWLSLCSSVGANCSSSSPQLKSSLVHLSTTQRRPSSLSKSSPSYSEQQLTGQFTARRHLSLSLVGGLRFALLLVFTVCNLRISPDVSLHRQRPRSPHFSQWNHLVGS